MDKIAIFKKIDKYIVGNLLRLLPGAKKTGVGKYKNILLIKTVALGDLVVLLPTIKALKGIFSDSKITLLTTPRVKDIVEGCPFIDEIIYYDILGAEKGIKGFLKNLRKLKKGAFDLSIDFEHYYNFTALLCRLSGIKTMAGFAIEGQRRKKLFNIKIPYAVDKHEVESFFEAARVFGAKATNPTIEEITFSDSDKLAVEDFLKANAIAKDDLVIGIHPSTSDSATVRRWLPGHWAQVIKVLVDDYNAKIIITGTAADSEIISSIQKSLTTHESRHACRQAGLTTLFTDYTLKQLAYLCTRLNLMISLDTGPMHISAAMGTKTIGLFGPNTPQKWGPYGYEHLAVYNKLDCSPCTKQYLGQVSKCKTGECMRKIMTKDVLMMVGRALNAKF